MLSKYTNHLNNETSPYLQQHAHNPVNWYPWSEEALTKARTENKPILLSIGYAACHWCHVMAHESFEDEDTAKLMNELFINIKVDREERPDLDKIYQTAHYLLSQSSGGWPLTIFLAPDTLAPFFSGTYFPKEPRHQLPAFKNVLHAIQDIYENKKDELEKQNTELMAILNRNHASESNQSLDLKPLQIALQSLQRNYDTINGGFGSAPKFPQPTILECLLLNKSPLVSTTLKHMAEGGIYDQLEGGFCRYSVDAKWQIPHFEKMLYDNAQLLYLYALVSRADKNNYFTEIAHQTAEWVIHKMQSSEGGYYSSLDADSEGHEGTFYVWDKNEIEAVLTHEEFELVRLHFGLDKHPNFEKKWHLVVSQPIELVATQFKITVLKAKKILENAKQKLMIVREKREAPACDNKILTSWNGLMIKGMFTAGHILNEPKYIASAQRALTFIKEKLYVNKRLLVSYKDGKAHLPAYLDDYAFLIDALITSLSVSWNTDNLYFAMQLADTLLECFTDSEKGGFFFTAADHEKLLYRPKTIADDAIPSGSGVAVRSLLTLGYLMGESRYLDAAEKSLQAALPVMMKFPAGHCGMLMALKEFLQPTETIIIRGSEVDTKAWQNACETLYNRVFAIPDYEMQLPDALVSKKIQENTCAYVCKGMQCLDVIYKIEQIKY